MGRDKALMAWGDQTLAESIAAKVQEAAGTVALVGRPELNQSSLIECIPDLRAGLGPLSGVETALSSGRGDLNLIVACDLPLLETNWLKLLLQTAEARQTRCVVASDENGRVHPLCAVYREDCLPIVRNAIDNGHLKLMEIIETLGAEYVELPAPLWNVNTPEEWQRCQEVANGR
jgi:molybdopterin-guanine dinucleotide biosynthesis protein A